MAQSRPTRFSDRLHWKMKHYTLPTTSTPKRRDPRVVTGQDILRDFGVDDSHVADYSVLLSPIAFTSPKGIVPPVYKAHPLSQRNVHCEPESKVTRQVRDISSKKLADPQPRPTRRVPAGSSKKLPDPLPRPTRPVPDGSSKKLPDPLPRPTRHVPNVSSKKLPDHQPTPTTPVPDVSSKNLPDPQPRLTRRRRVPEPDVSTKKLSDTQPRPTRRRRVPEPDVFSKKLPDPQPRRTTPVPDVSSKKLPDPQPRPTRRRRVPEPDVSTKKLSDTQPRPTRRRRVPEPDVSSKKLPDPQSKSIRDFPRGEEKRKPVPQKDKVIQVIKIQEEQPQGESPFSQLLYKYNEDEDKQDDEPLHVDPKKIVRTYASRKRIKYSEDRDSETEYDFVPRPTPEEVVLIRDEGANVAKKSKKKTISKRRKQPEDELDDAAKKLMEEINKEFENVEKVKLVIEQSFSD